LLTFGRNGGPDVVFLAVERTCVGMESLVLSLEIAVLDGD